MSNWESQPPPMPQPTAPQSSGKSIAVMVLGIVGLVFTCAYGIGVIAAIVSLALAPSAKKELIAARGRLNGEGFIKAGVICSWISVGLTVVGLIIGGIILIAALASSK